MNCMVGDGSGTVADKDMIGATEYMKIYYDDDPKGSITYRQEAELQAVWFLDDVSEEYHKDLEIISEENV